MLMSGTNESCKKVLALVKFTSKLTKANNEASIKDRKKQDQLNSNNLFGVRV